MINLYIKKILKKIVIFMILFSSSDMILRAFSLMELAEIALNNNSEILSAINSYQTSILSSKSMDGTFSPQLSFSSSSQISKDYTWKNCPDYLSSSISYVQTLPGGSSISISGGASVNAETIYEELYLNQKPNVSISLQQSLMPFWIQGKSKDPNIENFYQQEQYYYHELLNTKKSTLLNVAQNFVYILIYKKQIQISQNLLKLLDEQIAATKQLKLSGASSQSKITELLNSKWTSQQDLLSVQTNLESTLQNLKILCNHDIDISDITYHDSFSQFTDEFCNLIQEVTERISDPIEKNFQLQIEMLNNKKIINKQKYAPEISISAQPSWSMGIKKENEWKNAWKEMSEPSNWSFSVGINLSPFISASRKQNIKHYELDYESIRNSYNNYILKKEMSKKQYKKLFELYTKQLEEIKKIYENQQIELLDVQEQYELGVISKLDYDSLRIQIENCNLNLQINELYVCLYELLQKVGL